MKSPCNYSSLVCWPFLVLQKPLTIQNRDPIPMLVALTLQHALCVLAIGIVMLMAKSLDHFRFGEGSHAGEILFIFPPLAKHAVSRIRKRIRTLVAQIIARLSLAILGLPFLEAAARWTIRKFVIRFSLLLRLKHKAVTIDTITENPLTLFSNIFVRN